MTTLSLVKDGQKYVFQYAPGGEAEIVDTILRLADDEEIDWIDAVRLSFEVTRRAAEEPARPPEGS